MIRIENVSKSFDNLQILKGVSLNIEKGEIFGIVGRSGVGKSTLLRCVNGLEQYNSGSIKVDGAEVGSLSPEELRLFRKNVGMVFQNFSLVTRASVYENIAFAMKIWNCDKNRIDRRVKELLEVVGIPEKINARARDLSGGQKQRVALARALAMNPSVLLCDEATSALDPKSTIDILSLLDEINKNFNITIVMVTHEMEVMAFDGNNLPAEALMADEIDCLLLNHLPWMNNFNEQNGSELTLVKGFTYASLFGIYSAKHDSIEDIPENGTIIVSNDPANMHRSLLFMQKLGLMKLGEQNGDYYTVLDITENPKNLQIVEVETTNTAGSFQDADASISFSSVMRNAGIDAHSYLAEDGEYVNYPTGFFVNKGDEESAWAKALIEVTNTEDFQKKFDEIFQGAYMIFDYEG